MHLQDVQQCVLVKSGHPCQDVGACRYHARHTTRVELSYELEGIASCASASAKNHNRRRTELSQNGRGLNRVDIAKKQSVRVVMAENNNCGSRICIIRSVAD